ncbi:hypothetical protein ThesuDRAFT_02221 [Thermaerobacter subterraneus DSM 13965]|uniref:Uncharacterized protein n=1 Tax=Thermaerobacter subterraneus DSM 13965 TaxID=867903 RepID=K6Q0S0_9FIRM|nr:hypothetical protein ThesuDRAFT_02221 [Thermaerobacter subterraneus DSM 13965]
MTPSPRFVTWLLIHSDLLAACLVLLVMLATR